MKYLLSLDEGTTSARAMVFDQDARECACVSRPIECLYPAEGWVEQDPEQIWRAQIEAACCAIEAARIAAVEIAAVGITNQRETTIVWERATGRAVAPAIVWQDRRTAGFCEQLRAAGREAEIAARTGLLADPYFSGTKLAWILHSDESLGRRARNGELLFGTVDSWLLYRLSGGRVHATDASNASRTLLFNLQQRRWDTQMLDLLDVPAAVLPRAGESAEVYGQTEPGLFGASIPIAGVAGDQQSALFGQACFAAGKAKNTYGTGCFLLLHTGPAAVYSRHRLLSTVACAPPGEKAYALEGSVFMAGAAVEWMRDTLRLFASSAESEALAASAEPASGVYVVPAFVGLGAPYWDPHARAAILGLSRGTTAAQIARATLESIAYQTRDLLEAMQRDSGVRLAELRVDGGAARNNFLMQFQADLLGTAVVRPACTETTALGAAFLAGLAVGVWKNTAELEALWKQQRVFTPAMKDSERDRLYSGWQQAVARVLTQ
jgi:glycerol kinase